MLTPGNIYGVVQKTICKGAKEIDSTIMIEPNIGPSIVPNPPINCHDKG